LQSKLSVVTLMAIRSIWKMVEPLLCCNGADDGGPSHFPLHLKSPLSCLLPPLFFARDKTCCRVDSHWPRTSNSHWYGSSACSVGHSAGRSRCQSSMTVSDPSQNLIHSLAMLFEIARMSWIVDYGRLFRLLCSSNFVDDRLQGILG
jgi:hypothetical protein